MSLHVASSASLLSSDSQSVCFHTGAALDLVLSLSGPPELLDPQMDSQGSDRVEIYYGNQVETVHRDSIWLAEQLFYWQLKKALCSDWSTCGGM